MSESTVCKITTLEGHSRVERHPISDLTADTFLPDGAVVSPMPEGTEAPWVKFAKVTRQIADRIPKSEGPVSDGPQPAPAQLLRLAEIGRGIVKRGPANPPTLFASDPVVTWYVRAKADALRAIGDVGAAVVTQLLRERFTEAEVSDDDLAAIVAEARERGVTKAGTWVVALQEEEARRAAEREAERVLQEATRQEAKTVHTFSQRALGLFVVALHQNASPTDPAVKMFFPLAGAPLTSPLRSPDGWVRFLVRAEPWLAHLAVPAVGSPMLRIEASDEMIAATKKQIKEAMWNSSTPEAWTDAIARAREPLIDRSRVRPVDVSTPKGQDRARRFREWAKMNGRALFDQPFGNAAPEVILLPSWAAQLGCRAYELGPVDAFEILMAVRAEVMRTPMTANRETEWAMRLERAASGHEAWLSPGEGAPDWNEEDDTLGDAFGVVLGRLADGRETLTFHEAQEAILAAGAATYDAWDNEASRRVTRNLAALGFNRKIEQGEEGARRIYTRH